MVGMVPYHHHMVPYHHMHASHHVSTLMSLPECVPSSVLGPSMQLRRQKQLQKRKEIPLRAKGCAKITKIHARRHRMASSLVTVNNNPTKDPNGRSIHPSIHPSVPYKVFRLVLPTKHSVRPTSLFGILTLADCLLPSFLLPWRFFQ